MNFTTLNIEGKQYALVPTPEMKKMVQASEMFSDVKAYDKTIREFQESGAEALPLALTKRIIKGEHPVKVCREHLKMTQAELAKKIGVTGTYIFMLESGRRKGGVATLKKLAYALNVTLEELL